MKTAGKSCAENASAPLRALRKKIWAPLKLKTRKVFKTNSLPFLQLHVADHCNLNCKGCSHFSPIAPENLIDLAELEGMYQKLPQPLETWFSRLELMGGEPLLHPEIEEILTTTHQYFPNIDTRLVTNGLLLPNMPDSFFETCRNSSVAVYISAYPIPLDYDEIKAKLDSFGIKHGFYGAFVGTKTYIDYRLDARGMQPPRKNYVKCGLGGRCLQLRAGRLYPCFLSAYATFLNDAFHTNFHWEKDDFLTLDELEDKQRFLRFINNPVPFCRYCCMVRQASSPWGRSTCSRKEWIAE